MQLNFELKQQLMLQQQHQEQQQQQHAFATAPVHSTTSCSKISSSNGSYGDSSFGSSSGRAKYQTAANRRELQESW